MTKPRQADIVSEARKLSTSIEAVNWLHYPPLTKLVSPVPELLRQLADEVERLRKQIKTMQRDAREDVQSAANEARWQERQGEDYGSY